MSLNFLPLGFEKRALPFAPSSCTVRRPIVVDILKETPRRRGPQSHPGEAVMFSNLPRRIPPSWFPPRIHEINVGLPVAIHVGHGNP
jgi:hypothetical protein